GMSHPPVPGGASVPTRPMPSRASVRRVLVVDDTPLLRMMIADILEASGRYVAIAEAGNGPEALEKYRELRPDIVTLDIVMPEMDGIEACRRLLQIDPSCRVVMCSSLGQEPLVLDSMAAGARDFLLKPF